MENTFTALSFPLYITGQTSTVISEIFKTTENFLVLLMVTTEAKLIQAWKRTAEDL